MRKLLAGVMGSMLATAGALVAVAPAAGAAEPVTVVFDYTGAVQNWVVPPEVHDIAVELRGAPGGQGVFTSPDEGTAIRSGGNGGVTTTFVAVTPGELLRIVVGGAGAGGNEGSAGGFNGGGSGIESDEEFGDALGRSGGGGGASDIRQGGIQLSHRVAVAGGGGGAQADGDLGAQDGTGGGGGLSGDRGRGPVDSEGTSVRGKGGTQTAGGAAGTLCGPFGQATAGTSGRGGDGGSGPGGDAGGGGGGGLYGGGGGDGKNCAAVPNVAGGGGGGSGYEPTGLGSTQTGANIGPGQVRITYTPAVPGPPQNVSATAGNEQATVSFTPPASSGSSPVTSYLAVCGDFDGGPSNTGPSSPIVVSGLTNGVAVQCVVFAISAAGAGPQSARSNSVTPSAPAGVPGAPTGVVATRGNTQATVSFTPPGSNGGSPILDYTATCGTKTKTGAGSPLVVTGLTNGVVVDCTVRARNAAGLGPASSPPKPVKPATLPGAPRSVSATPGNAKATVSFIKPLSNGGSPILNYTATCGTKTKTGAASPLVVTSLANGVTVNCTVRATNPIGTGPASSPPVSVRPRP